MSRIGTATARSSLVTVSASGCSPRSLPAPRLFGVFPERSSVIVFLRERRVKTSRPPTRPVLENSARSFSHPPSNLLKLIPDVPANQRNPTARSVKSRSSSDRPRRRNSARCPVQAWSIVVRTASGNRSSPCMTIMNSERSFASPMTLESDLVSDRRVFIPSVQTCRSSLEGGTETPRGYTSVPELPYARGLRLADSFRKFVP